MHARSQAQRGFTLIEQVTAIAVMAVLVGLATPALARLVSQSAASSTEDALFAALRLARGSAVRGDTHSVFCPSRDGRHCSGDIDWQHGWIVAYDRDHDGAPEGAPLAVGGPSATQVRIIGSTGRPRVRFRANGSAPGYNLTLLICPRHGSDGARRVVVANSGRIREARAAKAGLVKCRGAG